MEYLLFNGWPFIHCSSSNVANALITTSLEGVINVSPTTKFNFTALNKMLLELKKII